MSCGKVANVNNQQTYLVMEIPFFVQYRTEYPPTYTVVCAFVESSIQNTTIKCDPNSSNVYHSCFTEPTIHFTRGETMRLSCSDHPLVPPPQALVVVGLSFIGKVATSEWFALIISIHIPPHGQGRYFYFLFFVLSIICI